MNQNKRSISLIYKLMFAPVLVSLLLLIYGAFSFWSMLTMQKSIALHNDAVNMERLAQESEATINATHAVAYRTIILGNSKDDKAFQLAEILVAKQMVELSDLERTFESLDDKNFELVATKIKEYYSLISSATDAVLEGRSLEDKSSATGKVSQNKLIGLDKLSKADETYDELMISLQTLGAKGRIRAEGYQNELDEKILSLEKVQGILLFLAVTLGLVTSYLGGLKIAKPLKKMQLQLAKIENTSDFSLRMDIDTNDEVGQTAESLNALLITLQRAIKEVNDVMMSVSNGVLSNRVETELNGDMAVMKSALNGSVASIQATMAAIDDAMNALQQGNFSTQLDLKDIKGDYRNTIEQANVAMESLRFMLGDVGEVMKAVSQGRLNLEVTAQGKGDLDVMKSNINLSLSSLRSALLTISQNARQVAAASSESSNGISQISDGAQSQTHAIAQVSAALKQTVISVSEVSRSTEAASQRSRDSVRLVMNSRSKMDEMVNIVNNIASNSEKINKITQVIEKIADMTNMLSLNAAIEAARAGEHGKGFAVVAEEVGKLALNSAESSQEIAQLVQAAVDEAHRAVAAVLAVNQDMMSIETGSKETDHMLQRISTALEEQSAAVEEINTNLINVDRIANSNAAASEQITANVMGLSRIADETRREVEKFSL